MPFTITISEKNEGEETPTLRYSQCLDQINLSAIIAAVNSKPPRVRNRPSRAKASYTVPPKKPAAPLKSDKDFLEFTEKEGK